MDKERYRRLVKRYQVRHPDFDKDTIESMAKRHMLVKERCDKAKGKELEKRREDGDGAY